MHHRQACMHHRKARAYVMVSFMLTYIDKTVTGHNISAQERKFALISTSISDTSLAIEHNTSSFFVVSIQLSLGGVFKKKWTKAVQKDLNITL